MRRQPLVITPELLHAAWQARRRADWPATFEACMADALLGRLVHAQAVGMAQVAQRRAQRAEAPPSPPSPLPVDRPRPTAPASPPRQAALFDPKRLAAGDHDDDD